MESVLAQCFDTSLAVPYDEQVDRLTEFMLTQEQADCPVIHRFGPGIYIREVTLPAGIMAVGHYQRHEHFNVVLKGKVAIIDGEGNQQIIEAPTCFVGPPGRKVGLVLEETIWQNIYATDETDVEKLEELLLDKSEAWHDHLAGRKLIANQADIDDYYALLEEFGISHEQALAESEREDNVIPLPLGGYKIKTGASPIAGKGLFATADIEAGELIAPARIGDNRTIAGRYTNHSATPNARPERLGSEVWLVAVAGIKGCKGGHDGEEITINYRDALAIAFQINEEKLLCQQ